MSKKVTMKDIANKLGVSSVTISKALNDKEGVSEEMRCKIKAVAEEMGYRIHTAAKSMKDGLSYNVGVMIPERFTGLTQSFYLQVYQQITHTLEQYNYYGILHILKSDDEDRLTLPKIYYEKNVDGFIILGQPKKEYLKKIKTIDIPLVFLDFYDECEDVDSVMTDNFFGAYELTNYLIQKGHKKIAYVGNLYATSSIQDRFLGYYKSLLEHHIEINPNHVINDRDENGEYVDIELPEDKPTAFVCNCDQVAHNLINKLKELGYSVPEDFSVVGFDNDIYATITEPKLTTVEVDIVEMASTSVRFMMEKIKNRQIKFGRKSVKGKIIYRDSVKDLPTVDRVP